MDISPTVLIVGAGPTGLMMASMLTYLKIPFHVIDKNIKLSSGSNAVWIQPRSLELLELLDLAKPFTKLGHHCNAIHIHGGAKNEVIIPTETMASTYPYLLMLRQAETERLLTDYLIKNGNNIKRGIELTKIEENNLKVKVGLKHSGGKFEEIIYDWVIACDGANSSVRNLLKIPFAGENLTEQFIVADAEMDAFVPNHEVHMFFDKKTLLVIYPLGSNKYRIGANLHQSHPRKFFIEKEIKEMVSERCHTLYEVHSVSWISPFWIQGRLIKNMRVGPIFFAGDAAHIHSPIIGQGMNSGLQDAMNLAWKLALVIKNAAKSSLLDTYHTERFPIVKNHVVQSDTLTRMALHDKNFLKKLREMREKMLKNEKKFSKKITDHVGQLDINYAKSPIIAKLDKKIKRKLKPGLRAPDVKLITKNHLYQYLDANTHHLLFFLNNTPFDKAIQLKFKKLTDNLNKNFPGLIKVHIVSREPLETNYHVILDEKSVIHDSYHVKKLAIFVIRPDSYIAYYSKRLQFRPIVDFFKKYLT